MWPQIGDQSVPARHTANPEIASMRRLPLVSRSLQPSVSSSMWTLGNVSFARGRWLFGNFGRNKHFAGHRAHTWPHGPGGRKSIENRKPKEMEKLHHGCEPRRSAPRMSAALVRRNTYRMQCLRYWTFLFGREVACASTGLVRRNQGCRWVVFEAPGTRQPSGRCNLANGPRRGVGFIASPWPECCCGASQQSGSRPHVALATGRDASANDLSSSNMRSSDRVIE